MATDIGEAYVQIVPSAKGISGSISSLISPEAGAAGTSSGALLGNNLLGGLKGILTGAAVAAAVKGLVDGIGSCVTEYANFDQAMSQVAATMGVSKDSITDLSDCAKEMGATTAFSADEAAQGLNILAMAGLDADEQMAVLPEVLNLASAGALDLESSASYVTGTIKGFGDSMDNAQYYADLMANGATLANTSVGDLGEALSSSAATANSYGQDVDSVTLSLLKLAEQNVTGSEASTALNRAMADLYTPTSAAKGALDELGVSCYDASGEARDFNDICDDLGTALSGYDTETQNAYKDTIFTTRGLQAYNKMSVTSKEKTQEFADAIADSYGSASQQAATQLDNLNGDMTLFDSAVSGLKISIGEKFDGICRSFVQLGTSALGEITEVVNGTKSLGDVFNDVGTAIVNWFQSIDWMGLGTTIKDGIVNGVATIIQEIPETLSNFATTVVNFLEGIDWYAVGSQVADFIINGIKTLITSAPGTIGNFCTTVKNYIASIDWLAVGSNLMTFILNGIKTIIVTVPETIAQFVSGITDKIAETDWLAVGKDILQGIIDGITGLVGTGISAIGDFCTGIYNAVTGFFQNGSPSKLMMEQGQFVVEGFAEGMQTMPESIDGTLQATLGTMDVFSQNATLSMTTAGTSAATAYNTGYSGVPTTVSTNLSGALANMNAYGVESTADATSAAQTFTSNTNAGLSPMPGQVNQQLTSALANVKTWGLNMSSQATTISKQFQTNILNGIKDLPTKVNDTLDKVTTKVTTWGTAIAKTAGEIGDDFCTALLDAMKDLKSDVAEKLDAVKAKVASYDLSSDGKTIGSSLVSGMISGINSKSSDLYSTIKSVVDKAVSTAKSEAGTGSPSKVFRYEVGEMIGEGLALGILDEVDTVESATDKMMQATMGGKNYNAYSAAAIANGANGLGGTTVNITQNIYSKAQTAADLMREAQYEARRAVVMRVQP